MFSKRARSRESPDDSISAGAMVCAQRSAAQGACARRARAQRQAGGAWRGCQGACAKEQRSGPAERRGQAMARLASAQRPAPSSRDARAGACARGRPVESVAEGTDQHADCQAGSWLIRGSVTRIAERVLADLRGGHADHHTDWGLGGLEAGASRGQLQGASRFGQLEPAGWATAMERAEVYLKGRTHLEKRLIAERIAICCWQGLRGGWLLTEDFG